MAIPRINKGERASGVPRGNAPAGSGLEPVFKGLSGLADVGTAVAAGEQQAEAEKLRAILEAKQAITNEAEGAALAGNFEEDTVEWVEGTLKKKYARNPEKAIAEFISTARASADTFQKEASNGQTALDFTRQSGAFIQAETRRLHDWALSQQTANAKGYIDKEFKRAVNGAALASSAEDLQSRLQERRAKLSGVFTRALGPVAGAAKLDEMDERATYAYADALSRKDPLAAAEFAKASKGPSFDNLTDIQRSALLAGAKADYEGLRKTTEFDLAREGVMMYGDVYSAMRANSNDVGSMILKKHEAEQALLEQIESGAPISGKNGPVNIKPEDRAPMAEIMRTRIKILEAMDNANRKQMGYDSEDDFALKSELVREHDELITGTGINAEILDERGPLEKRLPTWLGGIEGKGMLEILKHQRKLIEARNNGKIRISTYDTLHNDLVRVLGAANEQEEANTWHAGRWFLPAQDARQVGNVILNQRLSEGAFRELPEDAKINARYKFIELYNKATGPDGTREPTMEEGRFLALQALAIVAGKHYAGARK